MAVAFDSVTPDTESSAGVATLTSNPWTIAGSDRLLIGVIGTGDVSAATHSGMDHPAAGGALTQIGSAVALGTHGRLSAWRLIAPAAASNTTKGTWGSSQGEACIGGVSYTGVDQTTPVGTPVPNSGTVSGVTSFTASVNVTTTAGDLVFAVAFFHETTSSTQPTATPAGGSTGRYDIEATQIGGFGALQCIELVASGASTTMSVDFNAGVNMNGHWGIIAFVVNPASSATLDQEGARFGNDDGSESAHTFAAAQDASITAPIGTNLLARFLVDATGDPSSTAYSLRYQKNGAGGYAAVPVGATVTTPATYFGGASGGTNPTTSTTITIPSSLPANSVLSLHFTSRDHTSGTGQPTVSDNNGGAAWTQRQFSTDRKAQWWYKRVEANLSGKTITISGAVGSLSARLVVLQNVFATGDPFTDFVEESNAAANETHAAITPTNASSAVVFAVYNYANDNAVTSVTAATTGAPGQSTGHLSTGGSDCATHVAVWDNQPASSSGAITWAQTDGTTYSHVYAVKPLVSNNELYVSPSSNIAGGGEATTARLTAPSGKTTSDFVTGRRWDDENGTDTIDITTDDYTEVEWSLQAQSPAVNGDFFDLRVYAGGGALNSYSVTPRWTLGTPVGDLPPFVMAPMLPAGRRS